MVKFVFLCVCVCVCACVKRDKDRGKQIERGSVGCFFENAYVWLFCEREKEGKNVYVCERGR